MKRTKRIFAFALCLVMLISAFPVLSSADVECSGSYYFRTEILSYDSLSDKWSVASSATRGENMKVRFYLDTDFYAGSSQFMLCYPKGALTFTNARSLAVNPECENAGSIDDINFNPNASASIKAKDFSVDLEDFAEKYDYALLIINADLVDCFKYSASTWICETTFTVNTDCPASELYITVPEESVTGLIGGNVCYGFTTVFMGEEGKPAFKLSDAVPSATSFGYGNLPVYCTESTHIIDDYDVPPTCTEQGYHFHGCTLCGEGEKSDFVSAINHKNAYWRYKNGTEYELYCPDCDTVTDTKSASISIGGGIDSVSIQNGESTRIYIDSDSFIESLNAVSSNTSVLSVKGTGRDAENGKLYVDIEAKGYGQADLSISVPDTDISDMIPVNLEGREYTVTWINGTMRTSAKVREGQPIVMPTDPSKDYYDFRGWLPEVPATMPSQDVEFTAQFTPKKYSAKFLADGTVVDTVDYTVESSSISEPAVPQKFGYNGKWEGYSLTPGGITVNAVYTPSLSVYIKNMPSGNERTEKYKTTITFTAMPESLKGNAEVKWYKDNSSVPYKTGNTCEVSLAQDDYTIYFKVYVDGVEIAKSETETVHIKHKFFDKVIGFFRNLFKKLDNFYQ